jgi:hypothetical protein
MKHLILVLSFLFSFSNLFCQKNNQTIITSDIDNFWTAYDKITATKDSAEQYNLLDKFFLKKGTKGLKAIMEARRYTAQSYINAINKQPLFWRSVRQNTYKSKVLAKEIEANVLKIKNIYPDLKPAQVYFTIGAFRTNGTTMGNMVLIGSELALADKNTVTSEFSPQFSHLKPYFASNPIDDIVFLNTHEYVHTQQNMALTVDKTLLAQSIIEGVAEFVAVKATGKVSPIPAIEFGKKNSEAIRDNFIQDMFSDDFSNWLWNDFDNVFKMRDLGYYVGYTICEKYYDSAANKQQAIKEMIELNYNDEAALMQFVDKSGYFSKSIKSYNIAPKVIAIQPFKNGDRNVNPNIKQLKIDFSSKMFKDFRGFDFGPLGEKNVLHVKNVFGFSDDGKSIIIDVEMKPNFHYQLLVSQGFMSTNGKRLEPYLIDFTTGDNAPKYVPDDQKLYETIVHLDSLFFESYNTCAINLEKHAAFYADSLEFYHDKGGLMTAKKDVINGIKNNVCGKVTRELVKGSIEVYPINNYGAIEMGYHKFHNNTEPEGTPSHAGRFIIIWENKNNKWLVKRVISLH